MGNRASKKADLKRKLREKRARKMRTGKKSDIPVGDAQYGAVPLVIIENEDGEDRKVKITDVALEPTTVITGRPRSFVPPYLDATSKQPTGKIQYEVFPGVDGCAVLTSRGTIWITYLIPARGYWGEGQVDVFLDALHPRCRIINPDYRELHEKLINRGWLNEPEMVHDPNKGPESYAHLGADSGIKEDARFNREIQVWRPPAEGEEPPREDDDVVM